MDLARYPPLRNLFMDVHPVCLSRTPARTRLPFLGSVLRLGGPLREVRPPTFHIRIYVNLDVWRAPLAAPLGIQMGEFEYLNQ